MPTTDEGAKYGANVRVLAVLDAVSDIEEGTEIKRGKYKFVFQAAPDAICDKQDDIVGVDALVRVYQGKDELKVDPHRICINPPTSVVSKAGKIRYDPREAYLRWLEENVLQVPNEEGWNTRGTVTTVFADTSDGYITSAGATYTIRRDGTGTLTADTASATNYTGQDASGVYQFFCKFDTSAIPDGDTVSAVVFSLYTNGDGTVQDYIAEARAYDYGAAVTSADWTPGASLDSLTLMATFDTTGISVVAYNDFTSEAGFPAYVSKTGFTPLMVSSSRQRLNQANVGNEYWGLYTANMSGTTNDPKLVVTHAVAAASGPTRVPGAPSVPSVPGVGSNF